MLSLLSQLIIRKKYYFWIKKSLKLVKYIQFCYASEKLKLRVRISKLFPKLQKQCGLVFIYLKIDKQYYFCFLKLVKLRFCIS